MLYSIFVYALIYPLVGKKEKLHHENSYTNFISEVININFLADLAFWREGYWVGGSGT